MQVLTFTYYGKRRAISMLVVIGGALVFVGLFGFPTKVY
ncbi:hypothetical protein IGI80_000036 [Enterococcus sp. DIV1420a]